ncbi:MAG: 3-oxoacyl-[acyl-carrier-protein] synthase 3 [Candidatus Uhrbacteria bacterium GW2011_GWF2_39_13]|uniref:3-oxoacyl-[acyl-carrier-protein] synthase 3 n=1 Tax=Candidatus Uhrbacteria bacterium GW2011_GWF2_39_13 TaxID=1618995 RepID=A0A0G0Q3C0_9BACT|nr:MAG: 3-oxoacyl-[acyl-carrier-protein] synthase 3 [Candidatus Uhrbacteria bacterium GW2011_GWF2_39_13]HAU66130.1 hypothetical protein [Candidatus Uhrbacteria bacterium]
MKTLFVGTGSYVPKTVTNEELFDLFHQATDGKRPSQKNGEPVNSDWPERYFGIKSRCLDLIGNTMTDTDLAVTAAELALKNSGISSSQVGVLIHISPIPDKVHFQNHIADIIQRLNLATDVHAIYLDLGCCALGPALREVQANLHLEPETYVLLISSQCVSPLIRDKESLSRYLNHPTEPFAWLTTGTVFSDGAAAIVCKHIDDREKRGILRIWAGCNPSGIITAYENGFYIMNGAFVKKNFIPTMQALYGRMLKEWDTYVYPFVEKPFSHTLVKRWYFHQANANLIKEVVELLKIPVDRVPLLITTEGNSSAVSTIRLLDKDRRDGTVQEGDLVVFFWTGAGNGAQYGYSVMIV